MKKWNDSFYKSFRIAKKWEETFGVLDEDNYYMQCMDSKISLIIPRRAKIKLWKPQNFRCYSLFAESLKMQ